jgi:hypothetical protein
MFSNITLHHIKQLEIFIHYSHDVTNSKKNVAAEPLVIKGKIYRYTHTVTNIDETMSARQAPIALLKEGTYRSNGNQAEKNIIAAAKTIDEIACTLGPGGL